MNQEDDGSLPSGSAHVNAKGYAFLSDESPRDKPWDVHKEDAKHSGWILEREETPEVLRKRGERMSACAQQLIFASGHNQDGELTWRLDDARFCRVRTCPICQWRRSLMWKAKFYEAIPKVAEACPKGRWIFATFTVKNCRIEDLRDTVSSMNKSWHRLIKTTAFKNVVGWVRTTEVTRNPTTGLAHPHFHCLLLVSSTYFKGENYLSQAAWGAHWKSAARLDYDPVIDVRAVKGKDGKPARNTDIESLQGAVAETLKYSTKASDMHANIDWFIEFCFQISRLRFIASGGLLKEVFKDEETAEELLVKSDEPPAQDDAKLVAFNFMPSARRYARKIGAGYVQRPTRSKKSG